MKRRALITGITGQDGYYLTKLLLKKSYEVHGLVRRSSTPLDPIFKSPKLKIHRGDITELDRISRLIDKVRPHEIYNLAAQSHVKDSFNLPEYTLNVTALSTLRILEAMREKHPKARFYQASSSEMFGTVTEFPQTESTPFHPSSPYACAKAYAHLLCANYRKAYGLHVNCGILFNHESPRRGESFVTRKIAMGAARIKLGLQKKLILGNLSVRRDWGYAPEYVEAMWKMLQQKKPSDFVIATGETHSVQEFVEEAFGHVGLEWRKHVGKDKRFLRPSDNPELRGDPSRARRTLKWKARTKFSKLVKLLVDAELDALQ